MIDKQSQLGRAQIALDDLPGSISQDPTAHRMGLLQAVAARVIELRQLESCAIEFQQGATGTFGLAANLIPGGGRRRRFRAPAPPFLPRPPRQALGRDTTAKLAQNNVGQPAVDAIGPLGHHSFLFGERRAQEAPVAGEDGLPLTFLPGAVLVEAVRVGRPPGAIERALKVPLGRQVFLDLKDERIQAGVAVGYRGGGGWPQGDANFSVFLP